MTRAMTVLGLLAVATAGPLRAQRILGPGPDAVPLPRGTLRVELGGELTLQRDRWNDGVLEGLGAPLTGAPLDATRLLLLQPVEGLVRGLGLSDFTASLGHATLDARQRLFATPLGLEWGVTRRLTIGARATLVRTKTEALYRIRGDSGRATVGVNPFFEGTAVAAGNATTIGRYATAAAALASRRTACLANAGSAPECGLILAEAGAVSGLIGATNTFATGLTAVYGSGASRGQRYVPLAGSAWEARLAARADSLRTAYTRYGITSLTAGGLPLGAQAPVGAAELARLVRDSTDGFGALPLQSPGLTAIGDVHLTAKWLLLDRIGPDGARFATTARGLRQAILVDIRLGTGTPEAPEALLDQGTGTGMHAVTVRSLTDIVVNDRFWATAALGVTAGIGSSTRSLRIPGTAGSDFLESWRTQQTTVAPGLVLDAEVAPRWQLGDYVALGGTWQWRHAAGETHTPINVAEVGLPLGVDAARLDAWTAGDEHRVGVTATYSTLAARQRGVRGLAYEIGYAHLQSVAGRGGLIPKRVEDRILLRVYPFFLAR